MEMELKELFKDNDAFLKSLPSHIIYENFDNNIKGNTTIDTECEKLKHIKDEYNDFIKICSDIVYNLKQLYTMKNTGISYKDRCTYFIYWAFDEIWKKYRNDWNNKFIDLVLSHINKIINDINLRMLSGNPCSVYFDKKIDEWRDEKYLHDYFRNCDKIKNSISKNCVECESCLKYILEIVKAYDRNKEECCFYGRDCRQFFNCDDTCNPYELLKEVKCTNDESKSLLQKKATSEKLIKLGSPRSSLLSLTKRITNKVPTQIDKPDSHKLYEYYKLFKKDNNDRYIYLRCYESNDKDSFFPNFAKCYIVKANNYSRFDEFFKDSNTAQNTVKNTAQNTEYISDNTVKKLNSETNNKTSINSETKCDGLLCSPFRISTISSLGLGIFAVFFLYFKFTPFGTWLRRKLYKNNQVNYKNSKIKYQRGKHSEPQIVYNKSNRLNISYRNT